MTDNRTPSQREQTIAERTAHEKAALIEQLRKTPIVQAACEKLGIGRTSYYRWRDDADFAKACDKALADGVGLMNDMAEGQLLSGVRDAEAWAVQYWLRHRHPAYGHKIDITAKVSRVDDALTPEQEKAVEEALRLTFPNTLPASTSIPPSSHGSTTTPANFAPADGAGTGPPGTRENTGGTPEAGA